MPTNYLPDVNLWLALAFESHVHHVRATEWLENVPLADRCDFCRLTQQGFLRLATNPNAFGEEAVSMSEAWELFDRFLGDPRIGFLPEPTGVEATWRANSVRRTFSPKMWNDAYLAVFAFVSGYTVVTFDTAFGQYSATTSEILR